eukprot:758013-Hanusia_phi.AAC.2
MPQLLRRQHHEHQRDRDDGRAVRVLPAGADVRDLGGGPAQLRQDEGEGVRLHGRNDLLLQDLQRSDRYGASLPSSPALTSSQAKLESARMQIPSSKLG